MLPPSAPLAFGIETWGTNGGTSHLDEVDRRVYEALFRAAPEFPDEVGQIALEMCHRRSLSLTFPRRLKPCSFKAASFPALQQDYLPGLDHLILPLVAGDSKPKT